jgi:hypothetical protein
VRHLAADAFEAVSSVEHGKILATLTTLLLRPGRLSLDYFSGRRIRYLRPLTLALAVLALHLFAYSGSGVTLYDIGRTSREAKGLAEQRKIPSANGLWERIGRHAQQQGSSRRTVDKEINEAWARWVSFAQIPLILLFALVLQLVLFSQRRFLAEHLVFSMHFISFQVLVQVLFWPVYYAVGITLSAAALPISLTMFAIDIAYLFFAIRLFYGLGKRAAAIRAVLAFAGYFIVYMALQLGAMEAAVTSVVGG